MIFYIAHVKRAASKKQFLISKVMGASAHCPDLCVAKTPSVVKVESLAALSGAEGI